MPTAGRPLPLPTTQQAEQPEQESPWAVFIHNDEITPMDFVVHLLMTVFLLPSPNATQVMYSAHLNGRANVQTLPRSEARRRAGQARFAARLRGFPLEFSLEPE
jgi:ATP-dependent Clp protease adaptor protein ClpS